MNDAQETRQEEAGDTQTDLGLVADDPAISRAQAREGVRILQAELALQKQHLKLLTEQSRFLLACDRVRFAKTQEAFPALLARLEVQARQRTAMFGTNPVMEVIRHWPQPELARGKALAAELHQLITEIQTVSAQNRQMIGNELNYFEFMIDLIVNAHRQCVIYAANGANAANKGNLFLNRVA